VLATCNAVARVYLGAHNPLDVVGGAAIGLAITAGLDLVFDVARDRGVGWRGQTTSAGKSGPPEAGQEHPHAGMPPPSVVAVDAVLDCRHPHGKP
jgi:hypothetical protein